MKTRIIVSGREYLFEGDQLSYDDIVEIWNALHKPEGRHILGTPGIDYTDDGTGQSGVLLPGESIPVKDGTAFRVDPEHVS